MENKSLHHEGRSALISKPFAQAFPPLDLPSLAFCGGREFFVFKQRELRRDLSPIRYLFVSSELRRNQFDQGLRADQPCA